MEGWRVQALAVLLCGALFAGGCGDGTVDEQPLSRRQYQAEIDKTATYVALAAEFYRDTTIPKAGQQWRCDLKMGGLRYAADELRELLESMPPPPAPVARAHEEFVAAALETAERVDEAADDVESGDLLCGPPVVRRIAPLPSIARMGEAVALLREQGYAVPDARALGVF